MTNARKFVLSRAASIGASLAQSTQVQTTFFNSVRLDRTETHGILLNSEVQFLSYCLARRHWSRSQIMQDLWVCFELGEKQGGYFVEFGATNGLKNSNTWLLEKRLGWTGILSEPNPLWHASLSANRAAQIERRCVWSKSNDVVSFLTTNESDPELSGIADFSDGDQFGNVRNKGKRIEIQTISLDDLLNMYDAPPLIDYLSVDTEGSEFAILSNYSFSRKFKLISVESNSKNEISISKLLEDQGYIKVFKNFSQWDSWYVSSDLRENREVPIIAPES